MDSITKGSQNLGFHSFFSVTNHEMHGLKFTTLKNFYFELGYVNNKFGKSFSDFQKIIPKKALFRVIFLGIKFLLQRYLEI